MTRYFQIRHNSAFSRGMPEIYEIAEGLQDYGRCPRCGRDRRHPQGDLKVVLGKLKGRQWPDLMACGDYPCFVISDRFKSTMQRDGIRFILGGRVDFTGPNPTGLSLARAPRYYWVDGEASKAGTIDFNASGFVDVQFCSDCGYCSYDIERTYDRQHSTHAAGIVFDYDAASGLDLFTTDLSPTAFFCSDRVHKSVVSAGLTNVSFTPAVCRSKGGSRYL